MELTLLLGGVCFLIRSDRDLEISSALRPFLVPGRSADVTVRVRWDWEQLRLPAGPPDGSDLLLHYYQRDGQLICLTRGGPKGYIACCTCPPDCTRLVCSINEKPFLCPPQNLSSVLRFLPLRVVFQHFGILFLHASQAVVGDTGIVFSAPSGTGKTTQAKLWAREQNAQLICNDRTLLRQQDGVWRTYGYPIDGSAPVGSSQVHRLGCVVVLSQAADNQVQRLTAAQAAARLMPQMVIDTWSGPAQTAALDGLLALAQQIPIYALACTPDRRAVQCLNQRLREDGVLGTQ